MKKFFVFDFLIIALVIAPTFLQAELNSRGSLLDSLNRNIRIAFLGVPPALTTDIIALDRDGAIDRNFDSRNILDFDVVVILVHGWNEMLEVSFADKIGFTPTFLHEQREINPNYDSEVLFDVIRVVQENNGHILHVEVYNAEILGELPASCVPVLMLRLILDPSETFDQQLYQNCEDLQNGMY